MSYTCLNVACSAPDSKKGKIYPSAMECPFCDAPLFAIVSLDETEITLINQLPYVIAYPLKRALAEKHAWTRVNLLKDTFLNYLKYLGLVAASEFFHSPLKDKKMVALFQQALAEPSFGSWNQYIRETLKYLNEKQHPFFCADLPKYYEAVETGNKRKLYKGEIEYIDSNGDVQLKKQEATAIGMLINFRNRYLGHGLTLDEKASQQLWDEYFPIFRTLLEQMQFVTSYPMYKHEHGETYRLQSSELTTQEKGTQSPARVWMENPQGEGMDILPFFVVPGEVSLGKEDKEQILAYESYTGKTIKFFSPEGTEKQTSGKILEKLNLLLRDKQKEHTYTPEEFTKEVFLARVADENKLILDTLIAEKKVIPGVYVHREDMEIKLREWIGARANIFVIAAEAGSGKTNLLVEMQKQYTERAIPTLLIRAGRMEKKSLSEQLAYLLNINPEKELSSYTNVGGTQAEPTLVLIDGLNEANQAEALWQELLDISKAFTAGSLKIVVTSRASSKADVERYALDERDAQFMYGENKERELGLSAYVHWLTALNMAEMKDTWENYAQKEKNKYKPQFSFDDLATFDRALYSQISNPLVLRLFLETYHNKSLPKKGKKYLNIWADWLETLQEAEQVFFRLLSAAIWVKGENELLLDDILQDETLKPYLTDDRVNAPYQRLKNNGWISRYVKDLNACVSFTVEGALLYLMGKSIGTRQTSNDHSDLIAIAATGNAMKIAALENYLIEESRSGNIDSIIKLIDTWEFEELCIVPIVYYLQQYGTNDFVERLLANESDSDWKVVEEVIKTLDHLELKTLRNSFCNELVPKCRSLRPPLSLIITLLHEIEYPDNRELSQIIEHRLEKDTLMHDEKKKIQLKLANYYALNDEPHQALAKFEELLKNNEEIETNQLNIIAFTYKRIYNSEKAQYYWNKAIVQFKEKNENDRNLEAMLYFNQALYAKDTLEKIKFREKTLKIELEEFGIFHTSTAKTLIAIGLAHIELKNFDSAKSHIEKGYDILQKLNSLDAENLSYYGYYYRKIGELKKSREFYLRALEFELRANGGNTSDYAKYVTIVAELYYDIGDNYEESIRYYKIAIELRKRPEIKGYDTNVDRIFEANANIADLYQYLNNYRDALQHYLEAIKIFNIEATAYMKGEIYNIKYNSALCHYRLQEYEKARDIALQLNKDTDSEITSEQEQLTLKILADSNFHMHDFNNAINTYKKILEFCDDQRFRIKTTELIACSYEKKHQLVEALIYFQQCIEIASSTDEEIDSSRFYYFIGKIHRQLKNIDEAIIQFQKGQSISPKWYFSYQIAGCMEEMSDLANALKLYIEVAEMLKDDPEAGLNDKDTLESIQHAKRLAKELGTVGDLPQWITKTKT